MSKPLSDLEILTMCRNARVYPASLASRQVVRSIACPACHAAPNDPCCSSRGRARVANHLERVLEAVRRFDLAPR